ncbi:ArsR family transcriptional regulator [Natrarchaeobius sp. A-rgal3]|uniref:ArsR family transcriptional regulator n=1 Tax=Natrarchaeobius versutus TaxID=1679078 RepID=UPI0035108A93
MSIVDERILEFLRDEGARQPKQIAGALRERGMDYNDKYIGRRCLALAEHELLNNIGNGIYVIADSGERYLEGDLNLAVEYSSH